MNDHQLIDHVITHWLTDLHADSNNLSDCVSGLHDYLELSQLPLCLAETTQTSKTSIAFIEYFSKIIRQMKESDMYLLLDRKRFSWYAPIFPTSQSKRGSDDT